MKGLTRKLAEGIVKKRPFASLDDFGKSKAWAKKSWPRSVPASGLGRRPSARGFAASPSRGRGGSSGMPLAVVVVRGDIPVDESDSRASIRRAGSHAVEECSGPRPGPGQVLIHTRAIGVNPVETYLRSGRNPNLPLPYTPGTDAAGEVASVGPGVRNVKPGAVFIPAAPSPAHMRT